MTVTKTNRSKFLKDQKPAYKFGWTECEKGINHKQISTLKEVQADYDYGYGACWANTESLSNGVFN
jgi:hypothetical protein